MQKIMCEMCSSSDLIKQDGVYVCQHCGMKYATEEIKKMMIEGTVDVQGTVKVDNTDSVKNYLQNARRAFEAKDWETAERYYHLVEENEPYNIEAIVLCVYSRIMPHMTDQEYNKRHQLFEILKTTLPIIEKYYNNTSEDKEKTVRKISDLIYNFDLITFTVDEDAEDAKVGGKTWQKQTFNSINNCFLETLNRLKLKTNEEYVNELIERHTGLDFDSACYVATAVYGSYDCPEVWTLRRFRDFTLAESWYGRAFIKTYYAISPTLVKWFGETRWFKNMWRGKLDRMVKNLQEKGVENTPYNDKKW